MASNKQKCGECVEITMCYYCGKPRDLLTFSAIRFGKKEGAEVWWHLTCHPSYREARERVFGQRALLERLKDPKITWEEAVRRAKRKMYLGVSGFTQER
jgi:hypothetical protein